jgi:hypothetical protein
MRDNDKKNSVEVDVYYIRRAVEDIYEILKQCVRKKDNKLCADHLCADHYSQWQLKDMLDSKSLVAVWDDLKYILLKFKLFYTNVTKSDNQIIFKCEKRHQNYMQTDALLAEIADVLSNFTQFFTLSGKVTINDLKDHVFIEFEVE